MRTHYVFLYIKNQIIQEPYHFIYFRNIPSYTWFNVCILYAINHNFMFVFRQKNDIYTLGKASGVRQFSLNNMTNHIQAVTTSALIVQQQYTELD